MNLKLPILILRDLVLFPQQEVRIDLNNPNSKSVINIASRHFEDKVLVVCPKDQLEEDIDIDDLPSVGVIGEVKSRMELPNGIIRVTLKGIKRVLINKYFNDSENNELLMAKTSFVDIPKYNELEEITYVRKLKKVINTYIDNNPSVSNSIVNTIKRVDNVNLLTDIIATFIPLKTAKKLEYMQELNGLKRANNLLSDLEIELELIELEERLDDNLRQKLESTQKEYILKEKLAELKDELGEEDEKTKEVQNYFDLLEQLNPKPKIYHQIAAEIKKYEFTTEASPETMSIRNYLDWVLNLPWNNKSDDEFNLSKIRAYMDATHYGLKPIKDRIVENQAIRKYNSEVSSPIICLVGPPGVGKTSIAKSIAKSLNKKFFKISLGGMSDAAELNGHRRTYLGSQPGKIIKALKYCCTNNPVILLDEVDKMSISEKSDPASVLLDILDHEQNRHFTDNYIDLPFDISDVTFILTANDVFNIPAPLLDRLEIIELNSYTEFEKIDIAKKYLIPKILGKYNIDKKVIKIKDEIIKILIRNYTKEAGVRELDRLVDTIIRKAITYIVENQDVKSVNISEKMLHEYLGNYKYQEQLLDVYNPGMVNLLAYTPCGGSVSLLESVKYPGKGNISCTGSVGEVLEESIEVAISYLKNNIKTYKLDKVNFDNIDVHLHFLDAAIKKDGPSAGINIVTSLLSLFKNEVVSKNIAMTGEMSLSGNIYKVGGIKEKLIGAYNAGISTVYIPYDNINDLEEVPDMIKNSLEIIPVREYNSIYDAIFIKE